ncbi:MAG TPA: Ig-like domain-containing protein [Gemmatimonadaceae bacterium]|nr:Ig-like domain-containing protein [Gemmatimonadaceae bacterium]
MGLTALVAMLACSDPASSTTAFATIDVEPTSLTITAGESGVLTAQLLDDAGNALDPQPVFWSSQDTLIATVSQSGVVTAITPGTVQIAASREGKSGVAAITVVRDEIVLVRVEPISGNVSVGRTLQLSAEARTSGGDVIDDPAVAWSSSAPSVASVSPTGLVTALSAGSASIRASVNGIDGAAVITVVPVAVAAVRVSPPTDTIDVGGAVQLTATPLDASDNPLAGRTVTWSSSNESVALVSSSGRVQGLAAGAATITATAEGVSGSATVTVTSPAPVVASVDVDPNSASLVVGEQVSLTATPRDIQGNAISGVSVSWASSDSSVATVTGSGVVGAVGPGNATIIATAGPRTGTASIAVRAAVSAVSITPDNVILVAGGTTALVVSVQDAGGTALPGRPCTIVSANSGAATVSPGQGSTDANGQIVLTVTAVALGGTTITATCEGKAGSAIVVVL